MTSQAGVDAGTGGRRFAARFMGAVRLDATVFEEVEHDAGAPGQAAAVVAIAGLARAIQVLTEQGWTALSALVHVAAVAALVLAVRQALDTDTTRALLMCASAIGLGLGLLVLLGILLDGTSARWI